MTTAVVVRRGGLADAAVAAGALALAAAMTLLVPLLGAVRTSDGSPVWFASGALWVMVLPALLVAALAVRRPVAALAVAAGAGLVGATRLLADLPVLTAPDVLARPDLFVETTDRSLPFHAAGGGALLLAADLVTLAAGVFAAVRLTGRLSLQREVEPPPPSGATPSGSAPAGTSAPPTGGAAYADDPLAVYDGSGPPRPGGRRNNLLTAAGFVGVLLLAVGALTVPYQGGSLSGRYIAVGVPLAGMLGAVLLAVLAATAVLVGGSLPRAFAVALLGGVALGACLPGLVAIVAVASAPVRLSGTVWFSLTGGVLLAAAGLLARVRMVRDAAPPGRDGADGGREDGEPAAPSRVVAALAGIAGLLAAGLAAAAFALPALDAGGLGTLVLTDGSPVPGSTLFLAAAIPLAVAGVLALLPATARAGRAALMVLWAAVAPGVMLAMEVLGDDGLSVARLMHLVGIGAGTWLGTAALALAGVAAVLGAVAAHQAAEATSTVPDDDSVAAARGTTVPVATGLAVLTVIAACLPVYTSNGELQGPTILRGYTVETWGVWALLVATIGALAGAAVTRSRWVALALGLAAAAVQGVRLVVPAGLPGTAGFAVRPGAVVQAVLVLALVVGAVVLSVRAARIREVDGADPVPGRGGPVRRAAVDAASSQQGGRTPPGGAARSGGRAAGAATTSRPVRPSRRKRR